AQVFARFGVQVTVLEKADRVLASEEPEASEAVANALRADGVEVHTKVRAEHVGYVNGEFVVRAGAGKTFSAARLLVATGRRAPLDGLGLETIDAETGQRFL